ncbi:TRAP transporter small permease [Billgrantia endophytica]|uniref:TRAP transporter small permease protein n=1 Tax=Billgrantia endophytica TaxID=2033802 RepID=A0A2N7UAT5_9GAMM|nr:TRAP transporter small permease [Halomonas endophytica]PMR77511.1 C4-dicarboxylate ABC transporter permease [Halomonas endophytica]
MSLSALPPVGGADRLAYFLLRGITRVCDAAGVLLLAGILVLIVSAVLARGLLQFGMPWSEEVASILAIYAVGFGSLSAWVRGEHLLVDLFSHRMGALALHLQYRLVALLSAGFFILAAWGAWIMSDMSANNRTVSLGISFSYLYYGIFLGFAGMALLASWQALRGPVSWQPVDTSGEEPR